MKQSWLGISLLTLGVCGSLYSQNHYRLVPLTSAGITKVKGINDRQIVIGTDDNQDLVVAQPDYIYESFAVQDHLGAVEYIPLVSAASLIQVETLALTNGYYTYTTRDRRSYVSDFSQVHDLSLIGINSLFTVSSISENGILLANIRAAWVMLEQPLFGNSTVSRTVNPDELGRKVNVNGTVVRNITGSLLYADGTVETLPPTIILGSTRNAAVFDVNDSDVALWSNGTILFKRTAGEDLAMTSLTDYRGDAYLNNSGTTVIAVPNQDFTAFEVSLARGNQVTSLSDVFDFAANGIARVVNVGGINNLGQIAVTLERTDHTVIAALLNPTHAQPLARIVNASILAQGSTTSPVILGASAPKDTTLLLRAIGPGLAPFGVSGASTDPSLTVHAESGETQEDQDWRNNDPVLETATSKAGAFDLPRNSKDAALVWTGHGNITAVLGGSPGKCLMEIYDASGSTTGSLQNLSARVHLDASSNKATLGFVVSDGRPVRIMVRAMGPSLNHFEGLKGIDRPMLRLREGASTIALAKDPKPYMAYNVSTTVGAFYFDQNAKDVALFAELPPGAYTAEVSNQTGTDGDVLLEVYVLPDATNAIPDFSL